MKCLTKHNRQNDLTKFQFVALLLIFSFLLMNGLYLKVLEKYLYPQDKFSILGAGLILLICSYLVLKRNAGIINALNSKYGKMILLFFVLLIVPTFFIGGIIEERQDLVRPCLVVIRVYAGAFFFFVLAAYCKDISTFKVLHWVVFFVGFFWIIVSLGVFLVPDLMLSIFKKPGTEFHYLLDSVRFVPPVSGRNAMMYSAFYSFVKFGNTPKGGKALPWFVVYCLSVFVFLFVLIIRRNGIILLVVPALYAFFHFSISRKVILGFFGLGCTIIVASVYPTFFERVTWMVDSVYSEAQSKQQTSTNVRMRSFEYYYPELVKSGYIGYGYYGADKIVKTSRLAWGHKRGYLEVDLGIFFPFLLYGIQALIWTSVLYIFIFKDLIVSNNLPEELRNIRDTVFLNIMWIVLTLHSFIWGYHQAFWWGTIIFITYFISNTSKNNGDKLERVEDLS